MCQEGSAANILGLLLEDIDERGADNLALLLRILDAGKRAQKKLTRVPVHQRDVVVIAKQIDHLFRLIETQQAMVDKDAGQLLANRLVQQYRDDRGIDAARQPADHPTLANLRPNARNRPITERRHTPITATTRDPMRKVPQQVGAARCVHDFRVEHDAIKAARIIGDDREGGTLARTDNAKSRLPINLS